MESDQYSLPQQQQHFLHWEVGGAHAAELGYHGEEEKGEGLPIVEWWTYDGKDSLMKDYKVNFSHTHIHTLVFAILVRTFHWLWLMSLINAIPAPKPNPTLRMEKDTFLSFFKKNNNIFSYFCMK